MSTRPPEQLYETDFYAWTQAQAQELRRLARMQPNLALDLAHIAEEIRACTGRTKSMISAIGSSASSHPRSDAI